MPVLALVRGPKQQRRDHQKKQSRRRLADVENFETCPHGISVLTCRFEGRSECAHWLRAQIMRREFGGFTPPAGRRRGLTENGEWLTIIGLTVAPMALLLRVVLGG